MSSGRAEIEEIDGHARRGVFLADFPSHVAERLQRDLLVVAARARMREDDPRARLTAQALDGPRGARSSRCRSRRPRVSARRGSRKRGA
jgi:hypothetical protein